MNETRAFNQTTRPITTFDVTRHGLVIDTRPAPDYDRWHLPGALNFSDAASVESLIDDGSTHRRQLEWAAHNFRRMADIIDGRISSYPRQTRILVCGVGKSCIAKMWADALQVIGFKVDVLDLGVTTLAEGEGAPNLQPYPHEGAFRGSSSISAEAAVEGFQRYALAIDARSEREFDHDHIPGAVNLPVVITDEYAEVGTLHRQEKESTGVPFRAYLIGVAYSLRNMADALEARIADAAPDARLLVYCFRGGKRSRLWYDALTTLGYTVDRVEGGWKAYRRWVLAQLESLPAQLSFNVLCGPTGCGKTRLLEALAASGAQVLDLEGLARHRGSLIGALPGVPQPTQKWFDSLLLQKLRAFDPSQPIWTESESKKIGEIRLPESLVKSMHRGKAFFLEAPMSARVQLWREDYRHFESDLGALLRQLKFLKPLVGAEELEHWRLLAGDRKVDQLFERLMTVHYDPLYARSLSRSYTDVSKHQALRLENLDRAYLASIASRLHRNSVDA